MGTSLAWGKKLQPQEREAVFGLCDRLALNPDYLMSAMAFETGETFSPSKRNGAGSGATGLVQFMPSTAKSLGTTTAALSAMSFTEQLAFVERYFEPYRGRLHTLSDTYMAILWPKAIGQAESAVLWSRQGSPKTYGQNSGLDTNRDGIITKAEAAAKVQAKLVRGMSPVFRWAA